MGATIPVSTGATFPVSTGAMIRVSTGLMAPLWVGCMACFISCLPCARNAAHRRTGVFWFRLRRAWWRFVPAFQGSCQLMGVAPWAFRASFARLKGRLPKNPLRADNGDGWGLAITGMSPRSC